jgi:hypothetical protein
VILRNRRRPTVGGMAGEQLRRLGARELRPYCAEDEPAVLALWARALPRWPVGAAAFRAKATGAEQLVMVAGGALAGYISVARAATREQLTAILGDPAYRRAGLGSELLAQARRNLAGSVKRLSAGSGAGPYLASQDDRDDQASVCAAQRWSGGGRTADLPLSGASAASLHMAGCGVMDQLAATTMAGCRLMWPDVCGRWLGGFQ